MANDTKNPASDGPKRKIALRYEETGALYASQCLIDVGPEEVVLNFSSGYVRDPGSGTQTLPIHTRIAMTPAGAARLVTNLQKVIMQTMAAAAKAKAAGKAPSAKEAAT